IDDDRPDSFESLRFDHAEHVSAVAHIKICTVVRDAPAFSGIAKLAGGLEITEVIDKGSPLTPCQLIDLVVEYGNPLAEILPVEVVLLQDLTRGQVDLSEPGIVVVTLRPAGTFIEKAIVNREALSESSRVMRIFVHDLSGIFRYRIRGGRIGGDLVAVVCCRCSAAHCCSHSQEKHYESHHLDIKSAVWRNTQHISRLTETSMHASPRSTGFSLIESCQEVHMSDYRFSGYVDHIAVKSEDLANDVAEYERLGFKVETL